MIVSNNLFKTMFQQHYIQRSFRRVYKELVRNDVTLQRRFQSSQGLEIKQDILRRPIEKIVIANRGEIACRVIKTANRLGIRTVAVYSDVDKHSRHVEMANEAYHIGPPPSQQSYLRGDKILEVAKISGSQAVHPGYGFLSENLEFAERCSKEDVIFIGPPASAIRDMGIKSTSKAIMSAANVPIVQGYHGEDQSIDRLQKEAERIGFPLMIKAVRGGGGKGMRIAEKPEDFLSALESAKTESMKAFADDNVLLEQYITDPRHVEVQIFADMHGNAVYLFERDCSVQRRHQKIIEEAPAPGISAETRLALGNAAVRAAKAVGYVGAGTVEFILDRRTHAFHFMEMNTRLQVEHPITEMITGTDLVEWQLRVAAGEPLPLSQSDIKMSGHAFESRIYAEDPRGGFLPGAGPLEHLSAPEESSCVRVETGVRQGDEVTVHYDPMIAKLVVWADNRTDALAAMKEKLIDYQIVGLETNVNFLISLCKHEAFRRGDVHTSFIPDHEKSLFPELKLEDTTFVQAALAMVLNDQMMSKENMIDFGIHIPPVGWRPNYQLVRDLQFTFNKQIVSAKVTYEKQPGTFSMTTSTGKTFKVSGKLFKDKNRWVLNATIDDKQNKCNVVFTDHDVNIFDENGKTVLEKPKPKYLEKLGQGSVSFDMDSARSPMPGVLDKMFVKEGDSVKEGDRLFVIIAMKMEYVVKAPRSGVIKFIANFNSGDSVPKNTELIKFEPLEKKDE